MDNGRNDGLPVAEEVVEASPLHEGRMIGMFVGTGLFHISSAYHFRLCDGTFRYIQTCFAWRELTRPLVVKEVVQVGEKALTLVVLTWKRDKGLGLM